MTYIITQTTIVGKNFYVAQAEDADAAIRQVDEVFGMPCSSYSVKPVIEPVAYVASNLNPRKEQA